MANSSVGAVIQALEMAGLPRLTEFTISLAAAATIDVCTANGDVLISRWSLYVSTAGVAPLESVSLQTDQTTAVELLSAVEGAVGNLTAEALLFPAFSATLPLQLRDTQKIQATITGDAGTGELKMVIEWRPISANAVLT